MVPRVFPKVTPAVVQPEDNGQPGFALHGAEEAHLVATPQHPLIPRGPRTEQGDSHRRM